MTITNPREAKQMSEKISIGEDLMREHGLFNRLILLYKESAQRAKENGDSTDVLRSAAEITMEYIHEFHEEFEENEVYPQFDDNRKLHRITEIMEDQHETGKQITQAILDMTASGRSLDSASISTMGDLVMQFERMYIPHAAQEDTELWPALQEKEGYAGYMKMGAEMGEQEDEKFGEEYFDKLVTKVESLEKKLGIDDLAKFTAHVPELPSQQAAA